MRKVMICFFLVMVLLFCNVTSAYSMGATAEVLITGGTASANPVALVVGLLLLGGAGIDIVITDLADGKGMTKSEYLDSLLQDFSETAGKTYNELVNELAEGIECTKNGYIIIGESCASAWNGFLNWLFDSGLVAESLSLIPAEGSDMKFYYITPSYAFPAGESFFTGFRGSSTIYMGYYYGNVVSFFSDSSFTLDRYFSNGTFWTSYTVNQMNSFGCYYTTLTLDQSYIDGHLDTASSVNVNVVSPDILNSLVVVGEGTISGGQLVGEKDRYVDGVLGGIGALKGESVIARPDILDVPGAIDTDLTIPFPDYIDRLLELLNADELTDVPVAVEENTALPSDRADTAVEPIEDMNEFTYDIKGIFPFCIPFDLYDMLNLLVAGREAPHFEYRFYIPGIVDYTMEFDFAMFESLADLLRKMELLAFCVGLGFVTKSLIKW
ncbi:MAG: hypothetical protein NC086_09510 [Alistipes sp.]|nr:hypothetical protein [Alistipes sp.]